VPSTGWVTILSGCSSTPRAPLFPQFLQQRLRFLEVGRVKPLGELALDRCQQRAGFGALPLPLPQPGEAHGGPQFQERGRLATGHVEGVVDAGFRLSVARLGRGPDVTTSAACR
jgi:hypothetical protein